MNSVVVAVPPMSSVLTLCLPMVFTIAFLITEQWFSSLYWDMTISNVDITRKREVILKWFNTRWIWEDWPRQTTFPKDWPCSGRLCLYRSFACLSRRARNRSRSSSRPLDLRLLLGPCRYSRLCCRRDSASPYLSHRTIIFQHIRLLHVLSLASKYQLIF